jgi:hypothetical protein
MHACENSFLEKTGNVFLQLWIRGFCHILAAGTPVVGVQIQCLFQPAYWSLFMANFNF